MRCLILVIVVAQSIGCGDTHPPNPAPTFPVPRTDASSAFVDKLLAIQQRMHVRFAAADRIEQAIALSDIDRANAEARTIAALDEPDALPMWQPYLARVRDAAATIASAADPIAGATHTAELGRACAECHVAINAKVAFANDPAPAAGAKLGTQMAGHQWAALQMWRGVYAPSNERWLAGAAELETARLDVVAQAVTPWSSTDVDDVARVRMMATTASTTTPDERPALFGRMLAGCAHCHAVLRDREPKSAP